MPAGAFTDVAAGDTHRQAVDCMAWWGVAAGTSPTTYGPANRRDPGPDGHLRGPGHRGRRPGLPEPTADWFDDDNGSVHQRRINQLAAAGVVAGARPGSFPPDAAVTRAQMATLPGPGPRPRSTPRRSPSAPTASPTTRATPTRRASTRPPPPASPPGPSPGLFSPATPVTRAQVASFLARTLELLVRDGTAAAR